MTFAEDWARCAAWIQAALDHAGNVYTLSDVEFEVRTGQATFWPGARSALVTRKQEYPQATWLVLWLAGGDLGELRDGILPLAEQWGADHGCSKSVIMGRAGWTKALAGEGYGPIATVIGKELTT